MRIRIRGAVCGLLGIVLASVGVVSAVQTVSHVSKPEPGLILAALVRYYGLRGEILLMALGLVLLLAAGALLLSPRRIWVAMSAGQAMEQTANGADCIPAEDPATAEAGNGEKCPKPEPRPVCHFRTALMGSTFRNVDGSSRQAALEKIAVGDVLLCRSFRGKDQAEAVGVFTINGAQLGFLDAGFLRALRERYPGCQMGIEVERIEGGNGLPYTCHLLVAVYRL